MKRPIRRKQRKDLSELLPSEKTHNPLIRDLGQLRHEVIGLRNENEIMQPLKSDLAQLRATFADFFYKISEPNEK